MKNVAVIYGGMSTEHEVSIITAVEVMAAIEDYNVIPLYIRDNKMLTGAALKMLPTYRNFESKKFVEVIVRNNELLYVSKWGKLKKYCNIDIALICAHGGDGENGALQGLMEINNIPYTSANVAGSALCMDKVRTKQVLRSLGMPIVASLTIKAMDYKEAATETIIKIEEKFDYPVIVKPARQGSSIGVAKAYNKAELCECIDVAFMYDDKILVERAIENVTELNCAAFMGNELYISGIERPIAKDAILTFNDKYLNGGKGMEGLMRELPAIIAPELAQKIRKFSEKIYKGFDLYGVVRIDYLYDNEKKKLFVNEINTIPGSLAFYLFEECGIPFQRLIDELLIAAERRDKSKISSANLVNFELLRGNVIGSKGLPNKKN